MQYLGISPGLLWDLNPGEGVHGPLHLVAVHPGDLVHMLVHHSCFPGQCLENSALFLSVCVRVVCMCTCVSVCVYMYVCGCVGVGVVIEGPMK